MGLDRIMSISGLPGLYKLRSELKNGFLVESILDGKKMNIRMSYQVSLLSEIAVYTYTDEIPLQQVLQAINVKQSGAQALSHKSEKKEIQSYFAEVLPEYDKDRVYIRDMKKILQWYNILQSQDMLSLLEDKAEETEEASIEPIEDKKISDSEDSKKIITE